MAHCSACFKDNIISKNETSNKSVGKNSFSANKNEIKSNEEEREIKYHHVGYLCDGCDQPIIGIRYKCAYCNDFDFC